MCECVLMGSVWVCVCKSAHVRVLTHRDPVVSLCLRCRGRKEGETWLEAK